MDFVLVHANSINITDTTLQKRDQFFFTLLNVHHIKILQMLYFISCTTEQHGRVSSIPACYLGGPGFLL
jgi:hypothetical protein